MAMADFADELGINEDVARYLLRVVVRSTPPEVLKALNEMPPDELDALYRIGERFREAGATGYIAFPFGIH